MSNPTMEMSKNAAASEDDSCISGPLEWTLLIVGIVLGVAILLFLIRKIVQGPFYRKTNRIDGKVVIITGCNTGIGKETALELASRGAKIYMACRDPVRCEGARLEIIEKTKNENIFNRTLDLGSLESVRKFTDKFLAEEPRLDILINNAGVMATPKGITKDGFDLQFGTNHLGHFLLTNLLLDSLKQSAPSRIVVVSSAMYLFGKIHKEDLNYEKSYSRWGAYSQSKLANILFTWKLNDMLKGTQITVNCCHPGVVKTELARHIITGRTKSLLDPITRFFFKSPKAGAQTSIRLALDPVLEKSSGGYYFDTIRCPVLPKAKNKEMAEWLWSVSEEMVGIRPKQQTTVTLHVPPSNASNGHTTVIEVEQLPTTEVLDNKKMEEVMVKSNGTTEKKDISEKMRKMAEDERDEKQDEPEKKDKPEKVERVSKKVEHKLTLMSKEADKDSSMSDEIGNIKPEKQEQPVKSDGTSEMTTLENDSNKVIKDAVSNKTMNRDVDEVKTDVLEKNHTQNLVEKSNPMENVNAIENADVITETVDRVETNEKPIKFVHGPSYRKTNRIDGKVVIITGCNTGIGKETALELASRGAKIYMACRDPVRCEAARLEIIEKTKNENIFNRTLDLGSLESVRNFAAKFLAEESRLNILINNAGILGVKKGYTPDGFELHFGTNHLGHFLLTNLLLDSLKQSAPSRIVVVSSVAYFLGKIHKEDLNYEKSYSRWGAYCQSKLANILFTWKLNDMLKGTQVTVNCCHPGAVRTEIARHIITRRTKSVLDPIGQFFLKSPKAGAQTSIRLALDPVLEKTSGGYYFDTVRCPLLPKAKNKEMAEWLWSVSEEMVGIRPKQQTTMTLHGSPSNASIGHTTVIEVEQMPTTEVLDKMNIL